MITDDLSPRHQRKLQWNKGFFKIKRGKEKSSIHREHKELCLFISIFVYLIESRQLKVLHDTINTVPECGELSHDVLCIHCRSRQKGSCLFLIGEHFQIGQINPETGFPSTILKKYFSHHFYNPLWSVFLIRVPEFLAITNHPFKRP